LFFNRLNSFAFVSSAAIFLCNNASRFSSMEMVCERKDKDGADWEGGEKDSARQGREGQGFGREGGRFETNRGGRERRKKKKAARRFTTKRRRAFRNVCASAVDFQK
jgi:hypothetical protein